MNLIKSLFNKIWIHLHTYSKWEDIERGQIVKRNAYSGEITNVIGTFITQQRSCIYCGFKQLRNISIEI